MTEIVYRRRSNILDGDEKKEERLEEEKHKSIYLVPSCSNNAIFSSKISSFDLFT